MKDFRLNCLLRRYGELIFYFMNSPKVDRDILDEIKSVAKQIDRYDKQGSKSERKIMTSSQIFSEFPIEVSTEPGDEITESKVF